MLAELAGAVAYYHVDDDRLLAILGKELLDNDLLEVGHKLVGKKVDSAAAKYGHQPEVIDVVIGDGSRKLA